ncbi:hypothetical protein PIB30_084394 [Stylosanthes scabra]|uniref:Putative plant transposon protein domain-containing protein n=1 Tax=Stylosanthes scabra TaxID=79078 RepID=A0ABU6SSS1_9FABA|nr:hypothetical protein [Stylosanthes scabra]
MLSLDEEHKNRPPKDPNTFKNRYAKDSFDKLYYNKILHYQGQLAEDDQICQFVEGPIRKWNWQFLTRGPAETISPLLVREFYSNFYESDMKKVFLRGQEIPLKPGDIRQILGIPPAKGTDDYGKLISTPAERVPWNAIIDKICEPNSSWDLNAKLGRKGLKVNKLTNEATTWLYLIFDYI